MGYAPKYGKGTAMKKANKNAEHLVVRKIDAGTWSVEKQAVPGFRLSKSTIAAAEAAHRDSRSSKK